MSERYNQAVAILATILKCEEIELNKETTMQNTPKWDSFAHVELMMFLVEKFGVEMNEKTIEQYMSVEGIATLLE